MTRTLRRVKNWQWIFFKKESRTRWVSVINKISKSN
jgi:hypothetical protein